MKPLSLSKETTLILKGIAILMMIFLHLCNRAEYYSLCESFIHIDGTPLVYFIARACNPVGFFCFLSGYGVYYSYRRHEGTLMEIIIGGGQKINKAVRVLMGVVPGFYSALYTCETRVLPR